MLVRDKTRIQRYQEKVDSGATRTLPFDLACVNFGKEPNVAYAYRTLACFGGEELHLIGSCMLDNGVIRALSGSTAKISPLNTYKNPQEFIEHCRINNIKIISFELPSESFGIEVGNFYDYEFDFSNGQKFVLTSGGESAGIPLEILLNSTVLAIPLFGKAWCLNTSQVLNIAANEFNRQYYNYLKRNN